MGDVCRVAVVDVEPFFREGVVQFLRSDQTFFVAAEGTTAQDAEEIARQYGPDALLLGDAVPDGLIVAQAILRAHQNVKMIILASVEDHEHASQALHVGVHGYIMKTIAGPELARAITMVHGGERYISHGLSWRLVTNRAPGAMPRQIANRSHLSLRELQVLEYTSKGLTNQQIACKLGLSISGTKYYKTLAFRKLGVRNRVEAIATMNKAVKHNVATA